VQKKDNMFKAIFLILLSSMCAVGQTTIFKMARRNDNASLVDYFTVRCTVGSTMFLLVNYFQKIDHFDLPAGKSPLGWLSIMILRSVSGTCTFFLYCAGVLYAPVSIAFMIYNTNPFLISIFAFLLLGETIHRFEINGMILCFVGMCVLSLKSMGRNSVEASNGNTMTLGMVLEFVAACTQANTIIQTRRMKEIKTQVIMLVNFMFGLILAIGIILFLKVTIDRPISLFTIPTSLLLKLSLGGAVESTGVFCFTAAF
jgi:drug/metabolite transporter (DMT)-like permease